MSDNKISKIITSELVSYVLAETREEADKPSVTAAPDFWVVDDNILLWPPVPANRRNPIKPESNWIRHPCKILKRNIGNFVTYINLIERMKT